jgi:excisionase family DNA binding protein
MGATMTDKPEDRLLTAREAAAYLGYAEGTVRNKVMDGEIPFVKVGRLLRFRRPDLDRWVDEQTAEAMAKQAGAVP